MCRADDASGRHAAGRRWRCIGQGGAAGGLQAPQGSRQQHSGAAAEPTCCGETGSWMGMLSGRPSSVCSCTTVPHSASTSGSLRRREGGRARGCERAASAWQLAGAAAQKSTAPDPSHCAQGRRPKQPGRTRKLCQQCAAAHRCVYTRSLPSRRNAACGFSCSTNTMSAAMRPGFSSPAPSQASQPGERGRRQGQ